MRPIDAMMLWSRARVDLRRDRAQSLLEMAQGGREVGIAVGSAGENRMGVRHDRHAAVGPALDPDLIPQVAGRQVPWQEEIADRTPRVRTAPVRQERAGKFTAELISMPRMRPGRRRRRLRDIRPGRACTAAGSMNVALGILQRCRDHRRLSRRGTLSDRSCGVELRSREGIAASAPPSPDEAVKEAQLADAAEGLLDVARPGKPRGGGAASPSDGRCR